MPITSCTHETTMSVYIPYTNSLHSTISHQNCWYTYIHLIGTRPWTNMPDTLYIYVPMHFYCILHTDPTLLPLKGNNCNIYLPYICKICILTNVPSNGAYMPYAQITWHALTEEYANIYAIFELTGVNHVTTTAVHRWQWHWHQWWQRSPITFSWVGHWPNRWKTHK